MSQGFQVTQCHPPVPTIRVDIATALPKRILTLLPRYVISRQEPRHWSDIVFVKGSRITARESADSSTVSSYPSFSFGGNSCLYALTQTAGLTKLTEQVWQHENERVKRWRNEINPLLTFVCVCLTLCPPHSMTVDNTRPVCSPQSSQGSASNTTAFCSPHQIQQCPSSSRFLASSRSSRIVPQITHHRPFSQRLL